MEQFIEVDRNYRRKLFLFYAFCTTTAIVIGTITSPIIQNFLESQRGENHVFASEITQFSILCIPIIPALFLIWFGIKVISDKQYPYKGKKVIRRTRIITDKPAIRMGVLLIIAGVVPIILIISSILLTHSINSSFLDNPLGYTPRFFWNR